MWNVRETRKDAYRKQKIKKVKEEIQHMCKYSNYNRTASKWIFFVKFFTLWFSNTLLRFKNVCKISLLHIVLWCRVIPLVSDMFLVLLPNVLLHISLWNNFNSSQYFSLNWFTSKSKHLNSWKLWNATHIWNFQLKSKFNKKKLQKTLIVEKQQDYNMLLIPGKIKSVGSESFTSPTTESERTGVYLQNAETKFS